MPPAQGVKEEESLGAKEIESWPFCCLSRASSFPGLSPPEGARTPSLSTCAWCNSPTPQGLGVRVLTFLHLYCLLLSVQTYNLTHLNARLGFVNYLSLVDCAHRFKAFIDAILHRQTCHSVKAFVRQP